MAKFTDQQIRDKGFLYIPKQEFLQKPFQLPTTEDATEDEVVTDQGIVNTNAFANAGGDGDNFSVYNPDPNTISNQDYDDRPYQTALYNNSFPMMGDPEANIATGALNADGSMSYAGDDDEELTGIRSLISKGVNLIPGMGMLRTGAQAIGSLLPTNQRAIFENELGGQGIMVNDIGQIVQGQGDYNTGANIMAGYNANKITDSTVQKRIDTIRETIARKTKADPNYDPSYLESRLDALNDFNKMRELSFAKSNIVYANENYDPSIETPVGADTITGPDINEEEGRPNDPGPSINEQIDNNNPNNNNNNNNNNGGGGGGASDIADEDRGGYATDDTAGFFAKGGRVKYFYGGKV